MSIRSVVEINTGSPTSFHLLLHTLYSYLTLPLPLISLLFPYTTLFRSEAGVEAAQNAINAIGGERVPSGTYADRSEEHTSELQSLRHLVCRLLLEKKNTG